MHAFDYEAPSTLADAVALMASHNGKARPLAGGTDLIDQMRLGRHRPQLLIDVKKVPELNVLQMDDTGLHVGAAVPCHRICTHSTIREHFAALADSCHIIGGVQIQSRASVGGNLCNSGPAADATPSLIALRATCVIAGPAGVREVPVEQFCTGPGQNVLQPGELLVELKCPPPGPRSGSHYRRMIPRNEMDIAVVGVGASVQLNDSLDRFAAVRVGIGAVAPTPLLVTDIGQRLEGRPVDDAALDEAATVARTIAAPITDMRGTINYRKHVTGVLVKRVLEAAVRRARGETLDYIPGR